METEMTRAPPYKNHHLSFSRLTRYESCPLSYRLHYIDKHQPEPSMAPRFGKVIHAVLERLVRDAPDEERSGRLSEVRALALFREAWIADGLIGIELFQEGIEILRRFVREQGELPHREVLAVEKEFRIPVGPFTLMGVIDRVDRVDDETVEIIDYKTNHQPYTREELDTSLQMSLYQLAVRTLWPCAKKVNLTFWMLRHGIRQETSRTDEQLDAALAYVEMLGKQTEVATEFPPRLNPNCPYCDHRAACPAYATALKGKRDFVCPDMGDLEAVAKEREDVARLAKVLYARKAELEAVLMAHLKERDELTLNNVKYRMYNATKLEYPLVTTVEKLGLATNTPWNELVGELAVIDNKALDEFLKKLAKKTAPNRFATLKAELEAGARKVQSPRLWAKESPGS